MGLPRLLPLPLLGENRPDKFPDLSLRCPVIFLSSKSVRHAKSSVAKKHRLTPGWLGVSTVLRGVVWPRLISHGGHFLTKEISRDTSKKGLGTYPVDFHRVAAAAAAAAVGPFAGVKEPAARTLRANNNP